MKIIKEESLARANARAEGMTVFYKLTNGRGGIVYLVPEKGDLDVPGRGDVLKGEVMNALVFTGKVTLEEQT